MTTGGQPPPDTGTIHPPHSGGGRKLRVLRQEVCAASGKYAPSSFRLNFKEENSKPVLTFMRNIFYHMGIM